MTIFLFQLSQQINKKELFFHWWNIFILRYIERQLNTKSNNSELIYPKAMLIYVSRMLIVAAIVDDISVRLWNSLDTLDAGLDSLFAALSIRASTSRCIIIKFPTISTTSTARRFFGYRGWGWRGLFGCRRRGWWLRFSSRWGWGWQQVHHDHQYKYGLRLC